MTASADPSAVFEEPLDWVEDVMPPCQPGMICPLLSRRETGEAEVR